MPVIMCMPFEMSQILERVWMPCLQQYGIVASRGDCFDRVRTGIKAQIFASPSECQVMIKVVPVYIVLARLASSCLMTSGGGHRTSSP